MSTHTEPLVDHEDADSVHDGVSVDAFTPSLPSLMNRAPDSDAQSVSDVESISNGETISEAGDDFDEISYDEIPALAHAASGRCQEDNFSDEDMECVMMSDRTIIPDTPTLAQRMPQLSSEASSMLAVKPDGPEYNHISGLYMAKKHFRPSRGGLRIMFVGDAQTSISNVASIVSKIVGSITKQPADKASILDMGSQEDGLHHHLLNGLSIPVELCHVTEYHPIGNETVGLKGGGTCSIRSIVPDVAVLYRTGHEDFHHLAAFAAVLSQWRVPMLEVADKILPASTNDKAHPCTIAHSKQGDHHMRLSLEEVDVPMPLTTFVNILEDDDLSRHLSFVADEAASWNVWGSKSTQARQKILTKEHGRLSKAWSLVESPFAKQTIQRLFGLVMIFLTLGLASYLAPQQQTPMSELAVRTPMLQAALNNSGLAALNATDVLRYPTTTAVSGTSTTTGVAFPTAVSVHVAKSDQLLVSLPKSYWKSVHVGVFKNGKPLTNVNNTCLINGVISVSLLPSDAHGQIQISVLSSTTPLRNETVKVDLGNRLLQRVTYENVAKGVQHDVSGAHNTAKLVHAKVISDVQSVYNQSVSSVKSFGSSVLGGLSSTSNAIGSASNHTAHRLIYVGGVSYNTSSAIGSFLKSTIPKKHHLVRARTNALKIRTRLLRKTPAAKQNVAVGRPGVLPQVFSNLKTRVGKVQQQLLPVVKNTKKATPLKQTNKIPLSASKVRVIVKSSTIASAKSKQCLQSDSPMIKGINTRKQSENPKNRLKSA